MKKLKFKKDSLLRKIIIVAVLLFIVYNVFNLAILFRHDNSNEMIISIQNDVGITLVHEPKIEDDVVYISEDDMRKYFDSEMYTEEENGTVRFVSVVQTRVLDLVENENKIQINGIEQNIKGKLQKIDDIYYFPISDLEEVYNIKVDYLKDLNRLNIERLSREKIVGYANGKLNIKSEKKTFSKVVEKVYRGDTLTIVDGNDKNWYKVKTSDYAWGYVKKNKVINVTKERENMVSMDFSSFNQESAKILDINNDSYSIWSYVLANYSSRQAREKDIYNKAVKLIMDNPGQEIGVRISLNRLESFDNYYKFLKELKAYLNDSGICLIVTNEDIDTFLQKEQMVKSVSNILE